MEDGPPTCHPLSALPVVRWGRRVTARVGLAVHGIGSRAAMRRQGAVPSLCAPPEWCAAGGAAACKLTPPEGDGGLVPYLPTPPEQGSRSSWGTA